MRCSLRKIAATGWQISPPARVDTVSFANGDRLSGTRVNVDSNTAPAAGKNSTDTALIFKLDYTL